MNPFTRILVPVAAALSLGACAQNAVTVGVPHIDSSYSPL
jgi:hypothetical protein